MTKTITLEELQWMSMTDEERSDKLETLLADNAFGRLKDSYGTLYELTAGQIKTATALINKYKGDKRSIELELKNPVEEMEDAQLVTALNTLNRFLAGLTPAERADTAQQPAKAH